MSYRIITPAAGLPVSLEDLKAHLRIDHEDEDALLFGYLAAATGHVETILNRPLLATVMETVLPGFPCGPIDLHGRTIAVESITYLDGAEVEQTVNPSIYRLSTASEPGRVYLRTNAVWPATACAPDAVRIRYLSGFGTDPSDIPEAIRHALLLLVALWHSERLPVSVGAAVNKIPFGIECLIAPYKLVSF
ncbi:phage head-tail connector protein (plasmid) [Skermanella sp. TT6]|uniref:Phage head-tail connector protein n=1 Tax=Skermanella cutis TaxID=2775420 RepID=A0ABX7BHF2_9PROT|nr:head-tail connector protein [Skermanella sp. TT6]QQP93560.1 phage head-tail connector protein [Skermanella sp. TT6]